MEGMENHGEKKSVFTFFNSKPITFGSYLLPKIPVFAIFRVKSFY